MTGGNQALAELRDDLRAVPSQFGGHYRKGWRSHPAGLGVSMSKRAPDRASCPMAGDLDRLEENHGAALMIDTSSLASAFSAVLPGGAIATYTAYGESKALVYHARRRR
jgi:hypothetical protein